MADLDLRRLAFLRQDLDVDEVSATLGQLVQAATLRRQRRTALAVLRAFRNQKPGVLLGDDVGLGKTWIGAIVAVAFAAQGLKVVVVAPNQTVQRAWDKDLRSWIRLVAQRDPDGSAGIKVRHRPGAVQSSTIVLTTRTHFKGRAMPRTPWDLVVVDEAHRGKGETGLAAHIAELRRTSAPQLHTLALTATPFSLGADEMVRLLALCGASAADCAAIKDYSAYHNRVLWSTERVSDLNQREAEDKLGRAVEALRPHMIRHSIDLRGLAAERRDFGTAHWLGNKRPRWGRRGTVQAHDAVCASESYLAVLAHLDRAMGLVRRDPEGAQHDGSLSTRDGQADVCFAKLDSLLAVGRRALRELPEDEPDAAVLTLHLDEARRQLRTLKRSSHPKMAAVADFVMETAPRGEKLLVFCHHHAVCRELTETMTPAVPPGTPLHTTSWWRGVWDHIAPALLKRPSEEAEDDGGRQHTSTLNAVLDLLAQSGNAALVETWMREQHGAVPVSARVAARLLDKTIIRPTHHGVRSTLLTEARELFWEIRRNQSARGTLLHSADLNALAAPVACTSSTEDLHRAHDLTYALFNSAFQPRLLVTTDRSAESINLHRHCRLILHYEMSPSPTTVLQRNGRVRRVGCLGAVAKRPVVFMAPSLGGTRDEKLVDVVHGRMLQVAKLLGGVPDEVGEDVGAASEKERLQFIQTLKVKTNLGLAAFCQANGIRA
ncbi:MAG TPA: DEAD/DEAH box helicase [Polyangia bacterium]|jgi:hypothetical protein